MADLNLINEIISSPTKDNKTNDVVKKSTGSVDLSILNSVIKKSNPEQVEKERKEKENKKALDEISAFKKFNYGIDSTDNILTNTSLILQSKFPSLSGVIGKKGQLYTSPTELYGESFTDLSEDERRKVLVTHRQKELKEEYPIMSVLSKEGSTGVAETLGSIAKILVDPTILLPVGQTVKAGTAIGTGIGALFSVTEDLATVDAEIDKEKLALMSAFGGVASGVIVKGLNVLKGRKIKKEEIKDADLKMEFINDAVSLAKSKNVAIKDIPNFVQKELGMSAEDLTKTINNTSVPLKNLTLPQARAEQELLKIHKDGSQGKVSLFTDELIGNISTRIKNVAPRVFSRLRRHEFNVSTKTHSELEIIRPLTKEINKQNKKTRNLIGMHLNNGNYNAALRILKSKKSNIKEDDIKNIKKLLAKKQKDLRDVGYDIKPIANYFPRKVKDLDGLKTILNAEQRGVLNQALHERARKLKLSSAKDLPDDEVVDILNKSIRGFRRQVDGAGMGFSKSRVIDTVTEDMMKFYDEPAVALTNYIRQSVNDIERRTFLGRISKGKKVKTYNENIEESVGNYINKEIKAGNIKINDVDGVANLLTARFGMGEKSPSKFMKYVRDIGYGVTLGNPMSALVQMGDIGVSAWIQGNRNTIAALFGKAKVSMKDLGLDDLMSHELNNAIDTSKILGNALKYSGFRAADRYGKNVLLKASYRKATILAKSESGIKALAKKHKASLGDDEFNMLVAELKNGEITDRVKFYLWNELSDAQPISMSEMPQAYLNAPNGRIFYALKSFTLKQVDLIRKNVVQEYKAGNKLKAGRRLVGYSVLVGGMNGTIQETKDWMLGRGFNAKDIPNNSYNHLVSLLFAGQYMQERYLKQGDIAGFVANTLTPPMALLTDVGKDIHDLVTKGDTLPERTLKNIPPIGKVWYNFFGGGLERALERQKSKRRDDR